MRVAIAGAGSVGPLDRPRAARERPRGAAHRQGPGRHQARPRCPRREWLLADACEVTSLEEAGLHECQVVVAATGDDKVNLVVSLLAKTEFGVPRTVARVNHPKNEWMFDEAWGVDVAVSTPRLMTALVEEAVSVGDLVRIFTFQQAQHQPGRAHAARRTPPSSATRVGDVAWPPDTALVAIIREGRPIVPIARRPARGRRRAAVRRQPGHGPAARGAARPARPLTVRPVGLASRSASRSGVAPVSARRSPVDRRPAAGQQPDHRGQRRHLQRPAQRDLASTPSQPTSPAR